MPKACFSRPAAPVFNETGADLVPREEFLWVSVSTLFLQVEESGCSSDSARALQGSIIKSGERWKGTRKREFPSSPVS